MGENEENVATFRSISFSLDDNDSCFELSIASIPRTENTTHFEFQTGVVRPTLAEIFVESEGALAADELSIDDTIVPLEQLYTVSLPEKSAEQLDTVSLPEKSVGGQDAGEGIDNEARSSGSGTLPTGRETGHRREVLDGKNKQIILATRKNNNLLYAALHSDYIKNIIKVPVQRLRMAFKPEVKRKVGRGGEEKEEEPNTKNGTSSQSTTTRSSPVFRKLWAPISNWFAFLKPGKSSEQPKPKIVEICGQGTMIGTLKDITAGRKSAKGRPRSNGGEQKGRISKSAPSSPRHRSAFFQGAPPRGELNVERDASIGPAILHCKLSHLTREV